MRRCDPGDQWALQACGRHAGVPRSDPHREQRGQDRLRGGERPREDDPLPGPGRGACAGRGGIPLGGDDHPVLLPAGKRRLLRGGALPHRLALPVPPLRRRVVRPRLPGADALLRRRGDQEDERPLRRGAGPLHAGEDDALRRQRPDPGRADQPPGPGVHHGAERRAHGLH
ncbi:MAG TPA: hypothetical protein VF775_02330, partial [Geobacteraceae bacterium]